jgi:hypothetical protein
VGEEERTYGGFLGSVFYQAVLARDDEAPSFLIVRFIGPSEGGS